MITFCQMKKKLQDWAIVKLGGVLAEEMELLKNIVITYDKSDKVIKDCVVYTELPVNVKGNNLTFISCIFENLGKTMPGAGLMQILGLEA